MPDLNLSKQTRLGEKGHTLMTFTDGDTDWRVEAEDLERIYWMWESFSSHGKYMIEIEANNVAKCWRYVFINALCGCVGTTVDFDVAASPCYVGDSCYNTICSLINATSLLSQLVPLRDRKLAFRDIYGQSVNSVHYNSPFHGRVYRHIPGKSSFLGVCELHWFWREIASRRFVMSSAWRSFNKSINICSLWYEEINFFTV